MVIQTLSKLPTRKWLQIIFGGMIILLGFYIFLTQIEQAKAYYLGRPQPLWDPSLRISYFLVILGIYLILQAVLVSSRRPSASIEAQNTTVYGIATTPLFRWLTKLSALWIFVFSSLAFLLVATDIDPGTILQITLLYGILLYTGHTLAHFNRTLPEKRKKALIVIVALLWLDYIGLTLINAALGLSPRALHIESFIFSGLLTLPFVLLIYFVVKKETIAKICDTIFLFILTFLLPPLTFIFAVSALLSNFR